MNKEPKNRSGLESQKKNKKKKMGKGAHGIPNVLQEDQV